LQRGKGSAIQATLHSYKTEVTVNANLAALIGHSLRHVGRTAMKKFLVLYRQPAAARAKMATATPEQAKAGMEAWMNWTKNGAKTIVDMGNPLGGAQILENGKSRAGDQTIGGFSIVQGESADTVLKSMKEHPHIKLAPGASIEIHEFLPMPGQ
jgi:hypothetical protein